MNDRERRIAIFDDTVRYCILNLQYEIDETIQNTIFYDQSELPELCNEYYYDKTEIFVSGRRSFEAAANQKRKYPDKKVAVLNFASPYEPGGNVKLGSAAQEESLCRSSTLYNCLDTIHLRESYYDVNNMNYGFEGSDAIIYTPDVVVFKSDEEFPRLLERKDWCKVDVLTCAAPDLYQIMRYEDEKKLPKIYRRRIKHILHVAAHQDVDILILGAWGCGAFGGDPLKVAKYFKKELETYKEYFMTVEFAVYDQEKAAFSDNRWEFEKIFSKEGSHHE